MELIDILKAAVESRASDVHLMVGMPPVLRVDGEIIVTDFELLTPELTKRLIYDSLPPNKQEMLLNESQLCYSITCKDIGYFRVAIYYEMGSIGASIRVGTERIYSLKELGVPDVMGEMVRRRNGLVLITGPTGSGKTTTMNSLIDLINRERRCKIIMIEDPIEFIHPNKRGIIVQQELYTDTKSFSGALIHALRQDPNVIAVGEMRDYNTVSTALTAAETGHLVISTLHTTDAPQTIERIIDVFPPNQQAQARSQLANTILAILSQRLLARVDKPGRVLATGVLIANLAVRNIIRTGKIEQLYNAMHTGITEGMYTMDSNLKDLYEQGVITYDTTISNARFPDDFKKKD